MKRVAILQSNYIPWKGYFDLIASVDEFILYDDMQYTRQDWRNRNQVKTPQGAQWLTVPVKSKGKFRQSIREVEIAGHQWAEKHWKTLNQNYLRSLYFQEVSSFLEPTFLQHRHTHLSQLNRELIETVCRYLGITTKISNSWNYTLVEGKTERLVDICVQAGANEYISGPAAKGYIDQALFAEENIKLDWFDYSGYREYPQLWGAFLHSVTILDLLFNCGPTASQHMKFGQKC